MGSHVHKTDHLHDQKPGKRKAFSLEDIGMEVPKVCRNKEAYTVRQGMMPATIMTCVHNPPPHIFYYMGLGICML